MDGPRTLGQIIRSRRQALRLTQEELAARIGGGVRQAEVSRLESDRISLPRRQRLERIAAALGLPLGELLAGTGWAGADGAFRADGDSPTPTLSRQVIPAAQRRARLDDRSTQPAERTKLREALEHSQEIRMRTEALMETSSVLAAEWLRGSSRRRDHRDVS